jgi:hypothetical protein
MRNISRVDQEKKNRHGWLVRVMRRGITYQKFISDSTRGGERGSLREAKAYRDELLRLYPKPKRGNMFNRKNSRNKSGHPGVSRTGSYRKGRYYKCWQASWVLLNGKRVTKKFGFSDGSRNETTAKRLAIRTRREALAAMER